MADDINIDPALSSHPPSSVASDLTPLASPAISPYNTPGPSSLRHSRHASPDIAVPTATTSSDVHANGTSNNTAAGSLNSNGNGNNGHSDDVPVPQMQSEGAPPPLPPKPPIQTAGVKRKADDSNIMKCPYRESKKCKKEYKHKNAMRYHLEQAHHQEPDIQSHLSHYPPLPPSKKAKLLNSRLASGSSHANNASASTSVKSSSSTSHRPSAPAPSTAASAPNPFFGLFTHGYVFSNAGLPFRPHERPIDALYYLNILSTAGIKSQQQRASERLMINALLNADFIKHLQDSVNTDYQRLDLLDSVENGGMVKAPMVPIQPSTSTNYSPYTKRDADSAILKLAKTLQDVGLGDGIDNAQYF